jgi:PAS domain-containing protein
MTQPVPKQPAKNSTPIKRAERRKTFESDRRQAARELKDSEGRFRAVVEQSVAAIYVLQNQRIVYVNARMRELFVTRLATRLIPVLSRTLRKPTGP